MKITDIFVRRPVLAVVVNLVILIAGLQAIRSLSVRQYPKSDIAVVKESQRRMEFLATHDELTALPGGVVTKWDECTFTKPRRFRKRSR